MAAAVQELGRSCPVFVLAQTPTANTVIDFWSMIVSQRARIVVCLHGPVELLDPHFPQAVGSSEQYGDVMVTLIAQMERSHCIERTVGVVDGIVTTGVQLTILQAKSWPKK